MTAEFLYSELRRRELVRLSQSNPYADNLVRRVLEHPDFSMLIRPKLAEGFASRRERTQWLFNLNFSSSAKHRLSWVHLEAYRAWIHQGQPGQQPMHSEMLTSIGAGDRGNGGRKRANRTPSSHELAKTHGLRVGDRVIALCALQRAVEAAPEADRLLLQRLCGGLARQLPKEPEATMLEAVGRLIRSVRSNNWY